MPLTVNLNPNVAERIEQAARRERVTVQAVVNEVLRAHPGLTGEFRSLEPF